MEEARTAVEQMAEHGKPDCATGLTVFSGPLGGKTTLASEWKKLRWPVLDTDDVRGRLFDMEGAPHEAWRAWRTDHPMHALWARINTTHHMLVRMFVAMGGILIHHDPLKDDPTDEVLPSVAGVPQLFLVPGPDEMRRRAEEYVWERGTEGASRVGAALHWWTKAGQKGWYYQYSYADADVIRKAVDMYVSRIPQSYRKLLAAYLDEQGYYTHRR